MVEFVVVTILAVLLVLVYSLMRIAHDADERAEQLFQKYCKGESATNSTP